MTYLELLTFSIAEIHIKCLNFYVSNLYKNFSITIIHDILNIFYSTNFLLTPNKQKINFKFITIEFQIQIIFLNIIFIVFLVTYFNYILSILFILLFFFSNKFILFNSTLLEILHNDSADSDSPDLDNNDLDDPDLDEYDENKLYDYSFLKFLSMSDFDDNNLIKILLSIIKNNKKEKNNVCIDSRILIEKLMLSSNSFEADFLALKKKINVYNYKLKELKNKQLSQKKFFSLSEILNLIVSLNKIKNSILILPNGVVILTADSKNLSLFSLPAILKISTKNLNKIIQTLNLKKKLNLYLTKECHNLGNVLEKSFYLSEFLCTFDEKFNKDYLILEELKLSNINLLKFKLDYFYCNEVLLEEIKISLDNITQSLNKKSYSENKNIADTFEFSEEELKLNKVSPELLLENLAKIKTQPKAKISKKQYWLEKLKSLFTFIKSKFQDLTLPAIFIYYCVFKLILIISIKYTLIYTIVLYILYKYVYLNNNFWHKCSWLLWWTVFCSYIYYLYLLFLNNTKLIINNFLYYWKLCYYNFSSIDFVWVLLIYIIIVLPHILTTSDVKDSILYELSFYVNNWLINQLNGWTFLYIYLWPYIFICKNVWNFIIYALNTSYYRDPFICYFSKFLSIVYFFYFPSVIYENTINAGRISSFFRWLYWNPSILEKIKNSTTKYLAITYVLFKNFVLNFFKQLFFIFNLIYTSTILKNFLVYIILYTTAILIFIYLFYKFIELSKKEDKSYDGSSSYYRFSDTFGDNVREKLFDLIPLNYKIRFESLNAEWLQILNYTLYPFLKYLNIIFNFSAKNLWLYFKYLVYTKYVGSLIEFYCELHLWVEYYLFKILGGFLQPFFYIPHYVDHTTEYLIEIPWLTFMDMHKLTRFFGMKPLINSLEGYGQYRASFLWYQYLFLKNYQYEFNKKKNCSLHVFILLYWKLYLHFQFKQRAETKDRIFKSWYIWWEKNNVF